MRHEESTGLRRRRVISGHLVKRLKRECCLVRGVDIKPHDLVATVMDIAGKRLNVRHVEGPVGVQSRNFSNARIESLGWRPEFFLKDGIAGRIRGSRPRSRE